MAENCLHCGEKLVPSQHSTLKHRKYCSVQCSNQALHLTRTVETVCLQCQESFRVAKKRIARGWGKFCSNRCLVEFGKADRERRICGVCSKEFETIITSGGHVEKSKYCSRACYYESRKGISRKTGQRICRVTKCQDPPHCRGMCKKHYHRWQIENYKHKHPEYAMKWYWKNRDRLLIERRTSTKNRDYQRDLRARFKLDVLSYYTTDRQGKPVCARCGFDDLRALCLDHINNDGTEHRESISGKRNGKGASGNSMYRWVKKNGYPEGFQVLCANCNMIKEAEYREFNPFRNVTKQQ